MFRNAVIAFAIAAPSVAAATSANPDRPSVSASGHLVSPGTLEGELGGAWYGSGRFAMPLLVKYSHRGTVEPRVGLNLAGFGYRAPGITAEAKVKLTATRSLGMALYALSNVPVGRDETWWSSLRLLADISAGPNVGLTINTGADFGPVAGTVGVVGVPVILAASTPLFGSVSGYVEAAATIWDPMYDVMLDAGLAWRVTDLAVIDAAGGWDITAGDPYVALGVTLNAGHPGGR